ncbi:protein of unknown function [Azospirillum lipoferum 4B]|uniref:Uncharacterized protein n=1 Tax=Azospirillum lipoferum (strain 4B) TaxID=862719 RepID=G7Z4F8_AZOL4|nr:protein of unknown function [Azospirillum lipoferum 4B]
MVRQVWPTGVAVYDFGALEREVKRLAAPAGKPMFSNASTPLCRFPAPLFPSPPSYRRWPTASWPR